MSSLIPLPEDILVDIALRVADSSPIEDKYSLSDVHALEVTLKSMCDLVNDGRVLVNVRLERIPSLNSYCPVKALKSKRFLKRFRDHDNPEALYWKDVVNYFFDRGSKQEKGLDQLAKYANRGNKKGQYLYGLLLICLGGPTKQQGFNLLSPIIKPYMHIRRFDEPHRSHCQFRQHLKYDYIWMGRRTMNRLQSNYKHDPYNCDGRTEKFLNTYFGWHEPSGAPDEVCDICLCDHEIKLFFA